MPRRAAQKPAHRRRHEERERGLVLVWMAMVLVLMLGVAAMSVDLVHAYVVAQQVQNAADAAALAGSVSLPDNTGQATTSANNLAIDNGFTHDGADTKVTPTPKPGGVQNQMQVEIEKTFDTWFARAIGFPTMTVKKKSVAEYDPPVELGSPLPSFGNQPGTPGPQPKFWASVAGSLNAKNNGNAAMSLWCDDSTLALPLYGPPSSSTDNCTNGGSNTLEYETASGDPVQYFYVESSSGPPTVQVFDGLFVETNFLCDKGEFVEWLALNHPGAPTDGSQQFSSGPGAYCTGDQGVRWDMSAHLVSAPPFPLPVCGPLNTNTSFWDGMEQCLYDEAIRTLDLAIETKFELFRPDGTPTTPEDNDAPACVSGRTFEGYADISHATSLEGFREWKPVCVPTSSEPGRYVLRVTTKAGKQGQNNFALKASGGGTIKIYAVDRMALFTNESTTTGEFHLARVLPSTTDRTLRVQLFDVADIRPDPSCGGCSTTSRITIRPQDSTLNSTTGSAFGAFEGCKYSAPSGESTTTKKSWDRFSEAWGTLTATDSDCSFAAPFLDFRSQWITIDIPIPNTYSCVTSTPDACWLLITLDTPNDVTDTTTWSARFPGNPVRIVE